MKHLSKAELQTLYLRRQSLEQFIQGLAIRVGAGSATRPDPIYKRIKAFRDEIKTIVDDPQFDTQVGPPEYHYELNAIFVPETIANFIAAARELLGYVNTVLELHLTPRSKELEQEESIRGRNIFIGHGKNEVVRMKVKEFIADRCQLEPLVLQDLPDAGLTVIEKLEKYGRAADYAVLILTADDITEEGVARARQNVIQELGWFQGVLGRNRTAILHQKSVEIPSNIGGVVYAEFTNDDVEMVFDRLRQEFEECGILEPPTK